MRVPRSELVLGGWAPHTRSSASLPQAADLVCRLLLEKQQNRRRHGLSHGSFGTTRTRSATAGAPVVRSIALNASVPCRRRRFGSFPMTAGWVVIESSGVITESREVDLIRSCKHGGCVRRDPRV